MVVSLTEKPRLVGNRVELRPGTAADAPGLVELLHEVSEATARAWGCR